MQTGKGKQEVAKNQNNIWKSTHKCKTSKNQLCMNGRSILKTPTIEWLGNKQESAVDFDWRGPRIIILILFLFEFSIPHPFFPAEINKCATKGLLFMFLLLGYVLFLWRKWKTYEEFVFPCIVCFVILTATTTTKQQKKL